ncbi:hypothetical protein pb186bvf_004917 [Paramecium bursaria]
MLLMVLLTIDTNKDPSSKQNNLNLWKKCDNYSVSLILQAQILTFQVIQLFNFGENLFIYFHPLKRNHSTKDYYCIYASRKVIFVHFNILFIINNIIIVSLTRNDKNIMDIPSLIESAFDNLVFIGGYYLFYFNIVFQELLQKLVLNCMVSTIQTAIIGVD